MLIQNQQGFFGLAQNTFNIIDADIIEIRSKNEYDADRQWCVEVTHRSEKGNID